MTARNAARAVPRPPQAEDAAAEALALADWRVQVAALYAQMRALPDPQAAWHLWRETRDRLFREHSQTPLPPAVAERLRTLPCYDYDHALHFEVSLRPLEGAAAPSAIALELGADGRLELHPVARTFGLAGSLGAELTLYRLGGYGGGLFLPFADATAGSETYGGGRYLLDTVKGAHLGEVDGRLVLDFNCAYNPSCAYDARWTCPLAPPENRLPAPVRAGERHPC